MPIRQRVSPEKAALFNRFGRGLIHMDFVLADEVPTMEVEDMRPRISTFSAFSAGVDLAAFGVPTIASVPWPSAARGIKVLVDLPEDTTVARFFVFNGGVVGGSFDLGIYDFLSQRIISTGPTAQTGLNGFQSVSVPVTQLRRGRYFMAMSADGVLGQYMMAAVSSPWILTSIPAFEAPAVFPLPLAFGSQAPTMGQMPLFAFAEF